MEDKAVYRTEGSQPETLTVTLTLDKAMMDRIIGVMAANNVSKAKAIELIIKMEGGEL